MLEKMDSLLAQVNAPPERPRSSASSDLPRRLTNDDATRILRNAEQRQEYWGNEVWGNPKEEEGPTPTLDQIVQRDFLDKNLILSEHAELLLQRARQVQDQNDARRRDARMKDFRRTIGKRFADATIDNYQITTPEQSKVVAAVRKYVDAILNHAAAGEGVILFGAAGTGKTHLQVAVGKCAIEAGLSVGWTNGQDFFGQLRSAIDGGGKSESEIVRELVAPDVLIFDDVLPPGGTLSDYQASALYRVVDSRYRECRATLASMNVAGGGEAERGMGAQVVDRLRHNSLTQFCNWPSYRKAVT